MSSVGEIVPYTAVFIDAELHHFLRAIQWSTIARHDRCKLITDIQSKWITKDNPNAALPCLSVRTGLDLFLNVMNYPPGTEIVMSAVNIPDMVRVIHAHQLKVISLDIDLETMAPKMHLLPTLLTDRTKLLLVANIFGRQFDMGPVISAARAYNLLIIEDFAEGFHGFNYVGHPESDLVLFSFGAIKYETAFGGAIAKVRDAKTHEAMTNLYNSWPVQSQLEYLKKVFKCALAYSVLNCPRLTFTAMCLARRMNIDHKKYVVAMLRGFPDRLMERLRHRPCDALLAMMRLRFMNYDSTQHRLSNVKHEYIGERLPPTAVQVGTKADIRNHWLCPIMVDDPDEIVKALNDLGVDAYRGATQLNVIEPDNGSNDHVLSSLDNLDHFVTRYPHEAKYLIDHVVYLPVNKNVPFHELDRICNALSTVFSSYNGTAVDELNKLGSRLKLQSKL